MATTTTSRPGRLLIVLGVIVVLLFGIMGLTKTWKPKLGLDLRGGTTITLTANSLAGGGSVTADQLNEAKNIISQRVNGAGVAEADITTSGANHINVAVPGATQDALVKQVGQTALLYFRIVYDAQAATPAASPSPAPSGTPTGKPSTTPKPSSTVKPSSHGKADHHAERAGHEQRAGRRRPDAHPDADRQAEHPGGHSDDAGVPVRTRCSTSRTRPRRRPSRRSSAVTSRPTTRTSRCSPATATASTGTCSVRRS